MTVVRILYILEKISKDIHMSTKVSIKNMRTDLPYVYLGVDVVIGEAANFIFSFVYYKFLRQ